MTTENTKRGDITAETPESRRSETGSTHGYPSERLHAVLSNIRRRYVIYYAKRVETPIPFDELVDRIAAWENPDGVDGVSPKQRKSVHNALRQTHLPKLEQAGLVGYDRESNTITLTERADRVELYPSSESSKWVMAYSALSTLAIVCLGLKRFESAGGALLASVPLLDGLLVGLVLLTIGYTYDRLRRYRRFQNDGPDIAIEDS